MKREKVFTISKYDFGIHTFDEDSKGWPSFAESMNPLHYMINELYASGVKLGTKIKVTMEPIDAGPEPVEKGEK